MIWDKVWTYLTRLTQLTFLLLSVVIIVTLLSNSQANSDNNNYSLKLEILKEDMINVSSNNRNYLENRINRLQEGQDSYKLTTTREARLLDERLTKLERQIAKSPMATPVVNTNTLNFTKDIK